MKHKLGYSIRFKKEKEQEQGISTIRINLVKYIKVLEDTIMYKKNDYLFVDPHNTIKEIYRKTNKTIKFSPSFADQERTELGSIVYNYNLRDLPNYSSGLYKIKIYRKVRDEENVWFVFERDNQMEFLFCPYKEVEKYIGEFI